MDGWNRVLGSGGPLDIQSLGLETQINGGGNNHPAPTEHPPQTTSPPNFLPTPKQTNEQQDIQTTVTTIDPQKSSPATTSAPTDQTSANKSSQITGPDSASTVEGSTQSLTQVPISSPSLRGTLQGHGTSKGRIIAAVLGSILGLIVIMAAVFLIRRRRRRHATSKLGNFIATPWEREREPSIYDPRYQSNRDFDHFNHTRQRDGGGVERHLSMAPSSTSSFSLTVSGDTMTEEKFNFRLDHSL
jgi:hypothetical protein